MMRGIRPLRQVGYPAERSRTPWWVRVQAVLLGIGFILLTTLVLVMQFTSSDQLTLEVGEVSPRDIRAPGPKTFISQVLTERERERAQSSVRDIYDPPSARTARDQIAYAQKMLDYFSSIREDPYPSRDEQIGLIQTMPGLNLAKATISTLLDLSPKSWQIVSDQVVLVLDQAMRKEIRDNQLAETKRAIPALVSLDLTDEQAEVTIALAREFVGPNSLYNAEKTAEAKRMASDSVAPVSQTVEKGEIILREGDIADSEDVEILDAFELRQVRIQWPVIAGTMLFVLVLSIVLILYTRRFAPEVFQSRRDYPLLFTLLLLFIFGAKLMLAEHSEIAYLFPFATLAILVSVFFSTETAVGLTICLAAVAGFISDGSLELTIYALIGSLVACLSLGRIDRLSVLLWSGVYVTVVNVGVILAFGLSSQNFNSINMAMSLSFGMINGVLSASIALLALLFLGNLVGKITTLQLMELARPTHPVLRQLLLKAPGTYYHSLLVSNMAEQAAEQIGANSILARVGAYYHDIGKMLRPYFFVDNQAGGENVHDKLDPQTSAQIVINHVREGLELAQKYHLPPVIQEFIAQHHGTTTTSYFYRQATQQHENADSVDVQRFTYPGPRPQRKEVGIVMLADGCEAAVRAERPNSLEKMDEIIQGIILDRLTSGELNDSDLTMRDLEMIRNAFLSILQGVFHPRIKYPPAIKGTKKEEETRGAVLPEPTEATEKHSAAHAEKMIQSDMDDSISAGSEVEEDSAEHDVDERLSGKERVIRFRRG